MRLIKQPSEFPVSEASPPLIFHYFNGSGRPEPYCRLGSGRHPRYFPVILTGGADYALPALGPGAGTLALPVQSRAADRHRDGSLAGFDHGQSDMALQAVAITRHSGAAHDQHVGPVLVAQFGRDFGHAAEG